MKTANTSSSKKAPKVSFLCKGIGLVTIVVMNISLLMNGSDAVNAQLLDNCCDVKTDEKGDAQLLLLDTATRFEILESHKEDIFLACLAS